MPRHLLTVLVALAVLSAVGAQEPDFDLVVRGGRIVDGTGNPSFEADLGIRDGRIVALGRVEGSSARTIEAKGLIVAPGLVDIHNHSDESVLQDPDAQSMVRQGVTSMIFGEGGSAAPSARWPRFSAYFEELLRRGLSTNVGSYVGSSQVWTYVHGNRNGPLAVGALDEMRRLVREAMDDGALGVASSLSGPPGVWIDTETLVALCKVAGERRGIYSTHLRTEGTGVFKAVEEAIEIGRRANLPVDIIHVKIADRAMWGRMPELIADFAAARARGQSIEANVYPYTTGQNDLASIIPPWAHEGGTAAMIQRLQDRDLRPRLEREILGRASLGDWYNHYTATGSWEGMLLVTLTNPKYRRSEGKRMSEVIDAWGRPRSPPSSSFWPRMAARSGPSSSTTARATCVMRAVAAVCLDWLGRPGCGDRGPSRRGHPHPRFYGTFPRVLGRYVREARVLTLEEAVRKMTSANAAKARTFDRGLLRPGLWAM